MSRNRRFMQLLLKTAGLPFILAIKVYQWTLSPLIGPSCRYNPTCSNYALQAFKKYGLFKGLWLTVKRVSRCHPWGGHGDDPLP